MEDDKFEFPFESVNISEPQSGAEAEGSRSRRTIIKKTFDDEAPPSAVTTPGLPKQPTPKLKIKLGRGTKRGHYSKLKGGQLFAKTKDRPIDAETAESLDVCISILEKLLQNQQASVLEQASLPATFVPSVSEICTSLVESKLRKWARCPYGSSKEVFHEAGLYLRSQAVKNEHRKKIATACQGLLKLLEKMWSDAGFAQDLESLKDTTDERLTDSGKRPESNLRVTKARLQKMKRQEMEKEVKEAEAAIRALEKAKKEIEAAKGKLDKAKERLKESSRSWNTAYKAKLMHLTELVKAKSQAQKQKEKALAAIKASMV